MRSFGRRFWLTALLATVAARVSAAEAPPAYVLPETEAWDLPAADGTAYRIFVSRPEGPPPAGGYPVLYVLDGNAMFAGFAETRRLLALKGHADRPDRRIGQSIIVAVGHPGDEPYPKRRLFDFTPPAPAPAPARMPAGQEALRAYPMGGEDRFADFLLNRLRPEIGRRYPIDRSRQALFGHSLGGLFALHILYTRPGAFAAIVAASPSQWWNDQAILGEEHAFSQRLARGGVPGPLPRLLLVAGAQEEYVANLREAGTLAARLRPLSAFGLRSRFEIFADEVHVSVPSRAITTTLRFAFGGG